MYEELPREEVGYVSGSAADKCASTYTIPINPSSTAIESIHHNLWRHSTTNNPPPVTGCNS